MSRRLVGLLQPSTLLVLALPGTVIFAWSNQHGRGLALRLLLALAILQFVLSTPLAGHLALRSLDESIRTVSKFLGHPGHP